MSDSPRASVSFSSDEAFEILALLSQTLSQAVATSDILTTRGLSINAYALLAAVASDKATSFGKIARRAMPAGKPARVARASLLAAGLIEPSPDGRARSYVATAKGLETLSEIRAAGGEVAQGMSERGLRTVPRVASIVRDLVRGLRATRVTQDEAQI